MLSSRLPSVKDTYFQHPVLTKIHGQPMYESLQNLSTEIKANALSVPTTVGGGHYGHLGIVLAPARYAALPLAVPWVTPVNPGPFNPPPGATGPQIEAAKEVWRERRLTFELSQATEKALIAQLVEAIDPLYLRALLNRTTGQYSTTIREVFDHLFNTYGKITPQQVKAKEVAILNTHYSIVLPVDTVFNAIDDLVDLAEHGQSPITTAQIMDMAYMLLAKEPILQHDLRLWNRRPTVEKTWPNMLSHFREAQADLQSLPTAGDVYNHAANHGHANSAIAIADMVAQRLLDAAAEEQAAIAVTASAAPATAAVNAVINQQDMLAQLQAMMANLVPGRQTHDRNHDRNRNQRNRNHRGSPADRAPAHVNRNTGRTPPTRHYCWTHGMCAHAGDQCNNRLVGHVAAATFMDMQGGSTNNCFWLNANN
jgi:hypothetical protein